MFDPAGDAEWQSLLELLLNQETSFFRHSPPFAALREHVLPELMATAIGTQTGYDQKLCMEVSGGL